MSKVDFQRNPNDLEAATLAEYGLFSRSVGVMTGMTAGRAQYRIWKSGESKERKAWREGTSKAFRTVMSVVHVDIKEQVLQKIAQVERARQKKVKGKRGRVIVAER